MLMRACPRCNAQYADDVDVCRRDGEPLAPASDVDVAATDSLAPRAAAGAEGAPTPLASARSTRPAWTAPEEDRPEDLLGETLGAYRLVALIGKGGMGRVYLAEHARLGRQVALKVLRPEYAAKRDAVARFFGEARAVNRIRHRNIVDITDFVELDDGATFIIMELLHGFSLGQLVRDAGRDAGPLDVQRGLGLMTQVCDALAAAHAEGIIHRDLKPDNVFVLPPEDRLGEETVKLLDFGVAKLAHEESEDVGHITAEGSVVGTPAYMSPEQAGSGEVDARSDVYSFGAIMYEVFTGEPPFKGKSFGEYAQKHAAAPVVPPSRRERGGAVSPALESVILRCLAKHPGDRYPDVVALRNDLLRLQTGELSLARRAALEPRPWPRRLAVGGGVAMLLAGAAVGAYFATKAPPSRPTRARTAALANQAATEHGAEAAAEIDLSFQSHPAHAHVLDQETGRDLGTTPLIVRRPADGRVHRYTLRADGFLDREVPVRADLDQTIAVDLVPRPAHGER